MLHLFSKHLFFIMLFSIGAFFFSISVQAATPITINSVTGNWVSVTGGQNLTGLNTSQINWGWGAGTGLQNSGYRFTGDAPPVYGVTTGSTFNLCTFTHINYPVPLGTSITGARLAITASITIGTTTLNNINLTYDFKHTETPNVRPCQAGSISVCDDIVAIVNNTPLSDVFTVDGVQYTLTVLGFQVGNTQFSQFYTQENKTNNAVLKAMITAVNVPVPEPGTYMLLLSFLLLAFAIKRRSHALQS